MKKRIKNILQIVEKSETSSDEYGTLPVPKDDPLTKTPILIKRKLASEFTCTSPTRNTLTPITLTFDVVYLKPDSKNLLSI